MLALSLALALAAPPPERMLQDGRALTEGPFEATVHLAFLVWRHGISPGDGPRCPMQPSCSMYARLAVGRDGAAGLVLAFDRLTRDGNARDYPLAPDGLHALDPVDAHPPVRTWLGGRCRDQRADGAAACF